MLDGKCGFTVGNHSFLNLPFGQGISTRRFWLKGVFPVPDLFPRTLLALFGIISEFFHHHIFYPTCLIIGTDSLYAAFMLSLSNIFSNSSDIALCAFSFPFSWIHPKWYSICSFMYRPSCYRVFNKAYIWLHNYVVQPFGSAHFRTQPTTVSADFSWFIVTMANKATHKNIQDKPPSLFSTTPPNLYTQFRLPFELLNQLIRYIRLIFGCCSSNYDFSIPSSQPILHCINLMNHFLRGIGNYAPC